MNLQSKFPLVALEKPHNLEGMWMDRHLSRLLGVVQNAVLILLIIKCLFLWRLFFNGCL